MATDKLKKPQARNAQPPDSAPVPGIEGAYGNPPVSSSNDVAFIKTERLNPVGSGILEDQPREHGNNYPGREYPPVQAVTQATVQTGVAKKCADTQNDSNRREMGTRAAVEGQP